MAHTHMRIHFSARHSITNQTPDMKHKPEDKNAGDFVRTGPQRPDSHPFPNINKDRQRNKNFKNHKVTSGKLIRITNPPGRRLLRTTNVPKHFSAFNCMCHQGNSSNCAPSKP